MPNPYLNAYAEDEEKAREIGCQNLCYHSGERAQPKDLILETYGL
jgi:hypothetical protein